MSDPNPGLLSQAVLATWGPTLVVSPHADDEALGCGGLIALLCRLGLPVFGVLVSDCSGSHPASLRHDAAARSRVRHAEWQRGMACLGVPATQLHTLGWPDGGVPGPGDARFSAAVGQARQLLDRLAPHTVVLPWRRDPHADHRASHALFTQALAHTGSAPHASVPRTFEYAVWLQQRGEGVDQPRPGEMRAWCVDIADVMPQKRRAIACHRSQRGLVFTDDPAGFTLPPPMLQRALLPQELLLQPLARAGVTAHEATTAKTANTAHTTHPEGLPA